MQKKSYPDAIISAVFFLAKIFDNYLTNICFVTVFVRTTHFNNDDTTNGRSILLAFFGFLKSCSQI